MKISNKHSKAYSLVEVSISVFVLSIGVCSLLSIFPVAMEWGGEAIGGNTGSLAARTALAYLNEDVQHYGADLSGAAAKGDYDFGNPTQGGYFVEYHADAVSGTSRLYFVTIGVYKTDYHSLSSKASQSIIDGRLAVFKTYVID
jgi:hypothetical protein